jgi:ADP-ribosylglycohydrolase
MDDVARYCGCLLGLAVGDAVGTALEFSPPGTFEPITDMVGGGPFGLEPGQWTDDTSMALCRPSAYYMPGSTRPTRCGGTFGGGARGT